QLRGALPGGSVPIRDERPELAYAGRVGDKSIDTLFLLGAGSQENSWGPVITAISSCPIKGIGDIGKVTCSESAVHTSRPSLIIGSTSTTSPMTKASTTRSASELGR